VSDPVAHEVFGLAPVRLLQRSKTSHVKRLQKVRRVRRHADSDNVVILAVLLEIERVVALMSVNNKQSVGANYPSLCMLIKVL
jgi:hypothetical protein